MRRFLFTLNTIDILLSIYSNFCILIDLMHYFSLQKFEQTKHEMSITSKVKQNILFTKRFKRKIASSFQAIKFIQIELILFATQMQC